TAVAFNGTAAGFSVSSDTQLTATVPTVLTATTGPITVTNSVGTGSTSTNFSATPPAPRVTGFSPANGPAGTQLTITGSGFTGTTSVTFGGIPASFTVVSDSQIAATVPGGAINSINYYDQINCIIIVTTSPPMTLSPLFATFGNQVVGTTSGAQTFTLTNNTGSAINMGGIMIGGSNSSDYSRAGTCQANSPVAGGGSCTIDVTFTP